MSAPTTDRGGIQQVIRALKNAGWEIDSAWDGEESLENPTETAAIDWVMAVDSGHIYFRRDMSVTGPNGEPDNPATETETGWVFFVLGNAPDEVVNDYTTNLTAVDTLTRSWWDDWSLAW